MAEGEEDKIHSFDRLNKSSSEQTKEESNGNDLDIDLISEPDIGLPRRRERSRAQSQEDDVRNHKREENPFSFKQFLRRDGGARPKTRNSQPNCSVMGDFPDSSRVPRHSMVAPDVASRLPDFVQDHFFVEQALRESNQNRHSSNMDVSEYLPDFTQIGSNTSHDKQSRWSGNIGGQCFPSLPVVQDQLELPSTGKCKKNNDGHSDSVLGNALPDFLSDGPMFSNNVNQTSLHCDGEIENGSINTWACNGDSHQENLRLCSDNDALRQQLQEANRVLQNTCTRVAELETELTKLRCKEAEETTSLEKMVQQVEKNLQVATQRAATAEATTIKLKQEVKSLRAVLEIVVAENESLKSGDNHLVAIREKARNASEQISAATTNAEMTLKNLLSGVRSLKMVAAILADVDKVTETDIGGGEAAGATAS